MARPVPRRYSHRPVHLKTNTIAYLYLNAIVACRSIVDDHSLKLCSPTLFCRGVYMWYVDCDSVYVCHLSDEQHIYKQYNRAHNWFGEQPPQRATCFVHSQRPSPQTVVFWALTSPVIFNKFYPTTPTRWFHILKLYSRQLYIYIRNSIVFSSDPIICQTKFVWLKQTISY